MNDNEKFNKFLSALSETATSNIEYELLSNARLFEKQRDLLNKYREYVKRPLSQFHNHIIKKHFFKFNTVFGELDEFVNANFDLRVNRKGNIQWYELLPECRNEIKLWYKKRTELEQIVFKFSQEYKEFVTNTDAVIHSNSHTKSETTGTVKPRTLITKDSVGDFYYNGKLIKFKGKNTMYYWLFEVLYYETDHNGFVSYQSIDNHFVKQGKEKIIEKDKIVKRVSNALSGFFRYSGVPEQIPDGKVLIQKSRGMGLIFHNPPIHS